MNGTGNAVGLQAVPVSGGMNQYGPISMNLQDTQKGWLPDSNSRTYMQDDVFLQPVEASGRQLNPYPGYVPDHTEKFLQELIDPKIPQNEGTPNLQIYTSSIEHTRHQLPVAVRSEAQLDNSQVTPDATSLSRATSTARRPGAYLTTQLEAVSKLESEAHSGTPEEIESLRTRVVSLLKYIDASRKDDVEEATSSPNPDHKRKQLPCKSCKKTMDRRCDLK